MQVSLGGKGGGREGLPVMTAIGIDGLGKTPKLLSFGKFVQIAPRRQASSPILRAWRLRSNWC
jgi:hypothetical protein